MSGWNVRKTWWEFTKLVLTGRGGYEVYVHLNYLPDGVRQVVEGENWLPVDLGWVGADDRFAVLSADAEGDADA